MQRKQRARAGGHARATCTAASRRVRPPQAAAHLPGHQLALIRGGPSEKVQSLQRLQAVGAPLRGRHAQRKHLWGWGWGGGQVGGTSCQALVPGASELKTS